MERSVPLIERLGLTIPPSVLVRASEVTSEPDPRHWHASDELEYDTRRSARLEQRAEGTPIHAGRST